MRSGLDIMRMLRYRRPSWSRSEELFIDRFVKPCGAYSDEYGNYIKTCDDSDIIIACHTDSVHTKPGMQRIKRIGDIVSLDDGSNCLGADDAAGVYACLRMIDAGVKATFIFHRDEEHGGNGSQWLADKHVSWLMGHRICLSLDRRGTRDIITSQWTGETASDDFAISLSSQLGMGHLPADGIFTDSANYRELIPECSNISVGYQNEHSSRETLDVGYLDKLIDKLIAVDWREVESIRDPTKRDRVEWWSLRDEPGEDFDIDFEFDVDLYHRMASK